MSDLDPQSRAGVALQKLTDLISPNMAYWKCSEALTQLEVLAREIADRDAQIARAVTLAATTALRTDPARLFELEEALSVMCYAVRSGATSCAEVAQRVRRGINDCEGCRDETRTLIENELGIAIT